MMVDIANAIAFPRQVDGPAYSTSLAAAAAVSDARPVFCFSESALRGRARLFLDHFPGEVAFAVKANPDPRVILAAHAAGIEVFDVASTREMELVQGLCGDVSFHYHNPVKARSEITDALELYHCSRFAADSREEILKIADVSAGRPGLEIAIRFRLRSAGQSVHDFSSKFGVDETEAADLMLFARRHGFTPVLTFHPGSQCTEPAAWSAHIEAARRISDRAGVTLKRLNVGGGFPSRYATSRGPSLKAYFQSIATAVRAAFGNTAPELECEPGRGICAPAFSLLTRVKLVRGKSDDVFINDGIYGGLMEVYQAPDLMPFYRVIRDGRVLERVERKDFTVYGPTCDPLDVLPSRLRLPADIREGDVIEFAGIGAYGNATSTRFNGYGDADVVSVGELFAG